MNFTSLRDSKWYPIFLWTAFVVSLISIWLLSNRILTTPKIVASEDHWRYWTAWRITKQGENPYDQKNLHKFKDEVYGLDKQPDYLPVILTPPWTITLITPFAPFTYLISRLLWLLASIAILIVCANILWRIYNGPKQWLWVSWLVIFTLTPTLFVLKQAQINPWTLLGLVGFLYWTSQRRNDWLAGLSLVLVTIKPQLFLAFWIALLFWVIQQRRWKILLSCALGIAFASLVV